MFRKHVRFMICKDDVISVIDTLSVYGTNRIVSMKDGKSYSVSIYCEANHFQRFMEDILILTREGVVFRKLDISNSL